MPYRSHVQQLLPLDTLLGDEEFVLREVSDGTSEPRSLSESKYEDPLERDETLEAGEMVVRAKREESWSRAAVLYCESTICRV